MTESQIKSVALFFYYTLLDEELAEKACHITIEKCRTKLKKSELNEKEQSQILIHKMNKVFEKTKAENILNKAAINQKSNYIFSHGISFGAWRQFHKEATTEDLLAVVFSQILGFDDEVIATGLAVTLGSIRYRVSRGLRQLGHLITLGEIIA